MQTNITESIIINDNFIYSVEHIGHASCQKNSFPVSYMVRAI